MTALHSTAHESHSGLLAFPQVNLCALGQIRTAGTRFRRAVLYPLSYEGGTGQTRRSGLCSYEA